MSVRLQSCAVPPRSTSYQRLFILVASDSRVNPNGIALRKRGNSIASTVRGCSHQCLLRAAVAVSDSPTRPVLRAGSWPVGWPNSASERQVRLSHTEQTSLPYPRRWRRCAKVQETHASHDNIMVHASPIFSFSVYATMLFRGTVFVHVCKVSIHPCAVRLVGGGSSPPTTSIMLVTCRITSIGTVGR
jgi:hypothetical protein